MTDSKKRDANEAREKVAANLLAWIQDLETTDAKQGVGRLRTVDDEYCCLGRAACVLGLAWVPARDGLGIRDPHSWDEEYVEETELPRAMCERLGITFDVDDADLVRMNDSGEFTFPQIAAWLRENVLPRYASQGAVQEPQL